MIRSTIQSLAVAVAVAAAFPAAAPAADVPPGIADRLAPLLPAVVNIETVTTRAHRPYYFWGSGFLVEPSGIIVTNRHVIAGADRITVTGRDVPPLQARVTYVSGLLDLALLKVDAGKPLPVLQFADSNTLRVGDPVFAIGNPLGIGLSVSAGIVSALGRDIRETAYDDFIQTDAAINHGNSGGPLVDADGKVVGIDTALYSSPHNTGSIGLGFALPANDAKFIVDQVIRFGEVRAGWAGLHVQRVTEALAEGLGINGPHGVVVAAVDRKGPAEAAGIATGDVILRIAGEEAANTQQVLRMITEAPIGQPLALTVLHDGSARTVSLAVAAYPQPTAIATPRPELPPELHVPAATPDDPGMQLAVPSHKDRARFGLDAAARGVLVTDVHSNSAAADAGIKAGDMILKVRQHAVATPADVRRELFTFAHDGIERVALLVQGKSDTHWVVLLLAAPR